MLSEEQDEEGKLTPYANSNSCQSVSIGATASTAKQKAVVQSQMYQNQHQCQNQGFDASIIPTLQGGKHQDQEGGSRLIQTRSRVARKKLMAQDKSQHQSETPEGLPIMKVITLSASEWHQSLHRSKVPVEDNNSTDCRKYEDHVQSQNTVSATRKEEAERGAKKKQQREWRAKGRNLQLANRLPRPSDSS